MVRKLFRFIVTIGIAAAFIYGYEAFLMDSFTVWLGGFSSEAAQNAPSGVQNKINPIFGGIIIGASYAAKAFFAFLGIKVASLIFGK